MPPPPPPPRPLQLSLLVRVPAVKSLVALRLPLWRARRRRFPRPQARRAVVRARGLAAEEIDPQSPPPLPMVAMMILTLAVLLQVAELL